MVTLDAVVRPVQCPRCNAWCLLGQVDGFKTAVSATPLTLDGYRAALMAGLDVYVLTFRRLRRVRPGHPVALRHFLGHPCASWATTPLTAPPRAAQGLCPGRAGCTRNAPGQVSCGVCDPPPFEQKAAEELLSNMLGAKVIEVIENGETHP